MVIKLKMVCDEVEGFVREYLISDEATFLDLNKLILESCGYPDDQMTSFYILNDEWERGEQITRQDMGSAAEDDIYVMENLKLREFIDDKGQKLEFVFDPFSERSFFLSVKDVLTGVKQEKPEIKRIKGIEICIICFTSSNHQRCVYFTLCIMACKMSLQVFLLLKINERRMIV